MIHKARFNAIVFLLALFGGVGFGMSGGAEAGWGFVMLMGLVWFFMMLASLLKLAITGKPILYNTKVAATRSGDYNEY